MADYSSLEAYFSKEELSKIRELADQILAAFGGHMSSDPYWDLLNICSPTSFEAFGRHYQKVVSHD